MQPRKFTARDVAEWMTRELANYGRLPLGLTACDILKLFGDEFVRKSELGGLCIAPDVRREFRALNPDVIYERWSWRLREAWEQPKQARNRRVQ